MRQRLEKAEPGGSALHGAKRKNDLLKASAPTASTGQFSMRLYFTRPKRPSYCIPKGRRSRSVKHKMRLCLFPDTSDAIF